MRRFSSLPRRGDFTRLRQRGRRLATEHLTVYRADAAPGDDRALVGISVSKTVGKAVVRNKVRRRLAALLHDLLPEQPHMRLLVVARPSISGVPYAALRDEVRRALR